MASKRRSFRWFEPPSSAFLDREERRKADISFYHRLARNILDSYSRAIDPLAEVLQNSTDAIDLRSETEPDAAREILVEFDASRVRFSVTDTGVGMSERELRLALAPNVTMKVGELAAPRKFRARGEKGVGLSFIALACDQLSIRTCDGERVLDATIEGANSWARTEDPDLPPKCDYRIVDEREERLASAKWTTVTVSGLDRGHFDTDLFNMGITELVWRLRFETAVGNTAHLFESIGREQPEEIQVRLRYTSPRGTKARTKIIPYAFVSPEEFLVEDGLKVIDYEDIEHLDSYEQRRKLRGKALKYVFQDERSGGRVVDVYALVVDGREMRPLLMRRQEKRKLVPPDLRWQGMEVASRDMPTGVRLATGVLGTRAFEQRVFMLLQYDDLSLDLGRKTIAARTRSMLNTLVQEAWRSGWGRLASMVQPSGRLTADTGREALNARIEHARSLPRLEAWIPYLTEPQSAEGVAAIFHEVLASSDSPIASLRPLHSRIFASDDALVYDHSPNGRAPLHVLFAMDIHDLIEHLESDDQYAVTADLAVVWSLDDESLSEVGLHARPVRSGADGATHKLELDGLAGRESIRVLSLDDVLRVNGA